MPSREAGPAAALGDVVDGGFETYTSDVYGWAYRLLGRHHDALDIVQDVFLRWDAQRARGALQQPRAWLRRVTINQAIDHRRRRTALQPEGETVQRQAAPDDTRARLDRELLRQDVAVALDRLTEIQRSVLVAKVYDEMTFARIAAELGLAVGTVKTHYLRAVRTMRDRLQRRWGAEGLT